MGSAVKVKKAAAMMIEDTMFDNDYYVVFLEREDGE